MSITKLEIYSFWKDKASTNKFKVKNYADCNAKDEALSVLEYNDEICCWACGMPSLIFGNENYITIIYKELERTCNMKNIDIQIVQDYFSEFDYEKLMILRRHIIKDCTVHGSFVSLSSKMMALLSEIMKDI